MRRLRRFFVPSATAGLVAIAVFATTALAVERTPAPAGAEVFIIEPTDGATVSSPVTVYFGLAGMGVAPAGVEWENTGHHHLLLNMGEVESYEVALPADDNHRHFGGGQTQVILELEPGEHTLQLLLADWQHVPHDQPLMSERITITVE